MLSKAIKGYQIGPLTDPQDLSEANRTFLQHFLGQEQKLQEKKRIKHLGSEPQKNGSAIFSSFFVPPIQIHLKRAVQADFSTWENGILSFG
jgi:hypothetical protein